MTDLIVPMVPDGSYDVRTANGVQTYTPVPAGKRLAALSPRLTLCDLAENFASQFGGLVELKGKGKHHPVIVAMLQRYGTWILDDETAWCGAFAATILELTGHPVPSIEKYSPLKARHYLSIGEPVTDLSKLDRNCWLVFARGRAGKFPGPEVLNAPGHVTFYHSHRTIGGRATLGGFGGNQQNRAKLSDYGPTRLLGARRAVWA